jgi:hypothetical protein
VDLPRRERLVSRMSEDIPQIPRVPGGRRHGLPEMMEWFDGDPRALREAVRLLAGDYQLLEPTAARHLWRDPWGSARVLGLAYAQVEDPNRKGEVGWRAVDPKPHGVSLIPRLITDLAAAVRDGRAILPGTEAERTEHERWLFGLEAEARIGPPLVVLALAAAGLCFFAFLVRNLSRLVVF